MLDRLRAEPSSPAAAPPRNEVRAQAPAPETPRTRALRKAAWTRVRMLDRLRTELAPVAEIGRNDLINALITAIALQFDLEGGRVSPEWIRWFATTVGGIEGMMAEAALGDDEFSNLLGTVDHISSVWQRPPGCFRWMMDGAHDGDGPYRCPEPVVMRGWWYSPKKEWVEVETCAGHRNGVMRDHRRREKTLPPS